MINNPHSSQHEEHSSKDIDFDKPIDLRQPDTDTDIDFQESKNTQEKTTVDEEVSTQPIVYPNPNSQKKTTVDAEASTQKTTFPNQGFQNKKQTTQSKTQTQSIGQTSSNTAKDVNNNSNHRKLRHNFSEKEFNDYVEELNDNAAKKYYVLFFGRPASGKTHIIASITNHLKQASSGVTINYQKTGDRFIDGQEILLSDFFENPKEISVDPTDKSAWFEFKYKINHQDESKKDQDYELVFVDFNGEVLQTSVFDELPDSIKAIFESDVNITVAFVFDYERHVSKPETGEHNQINGLNNIFNELSKYQEIKKKKYKKVLIFSKSDLLKNEFSGYSATEFALEKVPKIAKNLSNEKHNGKHLNTAMFYSIGEFNAKSLVAQNTQILDKDRINYEDPELLLGWLRGLKEPEIGKKTSILPWKK